MINFEIIEDFPKSEIEFENRFSTERSCYEYLFRKKWPTGFSCCKCSTLRVAPQYTLWGRGALKVSESFFGRNTGKRLSRNRLYRTKERPGKDDRLTISFPGRLGG